MAATQSILYVHNTDIDRARWDACIDQADNGLIYAYAFFLDSMCEHWDALILGDYEAVMPLPWQQKYFVKYLYQPYYIPSLGVFGKNIAPDIVIQFLNAIPPKFRYWDIDLSENNVINETCYPLDIKITPRKNIVLKLDAYTNCLTNYSRLAKRKLAKARKNGLTIRKEANPNLIIKHYIEEYETKKRIIPDSIYTKLNEVTLKLGNHNFKTYIATTDSGEVAAFYLIFIDNKYVYSVLGGSTDIGKKYGAFYLLTDAIIQDFSGTGKFFRFEGSDIPGIAFFNLQFGSYTLEYFHIRRNKLPPPIRWLK